jgi:hypothetical protein
MARPKRPDPHTARFLISLTPEDRQRVKIKAITAGVTMGAIARHLLLAWADGRVAIMQEPKVEAKND